MTQDVEQLMTWLLLHLLHLHHCCPAATAATTGHGVMRDMEQLMAWLLWLRRSGRGLWRSYVDLLPQVQDSCFAMHGASFLLVAVGLPDFAVLCTASSTATIEVQKLTCTPASPLCGRATPLPRCPSSSRKLSWMSCRCRAWRRQPGTTAASLLASTNGEGLLLAWWARHNSTAAGGV